MYITQTSTCTNEHQKPWKNSVHEHLKTPVKGEAIDPKTDSQMKQFWFLWLPMTHQNLPGL